MHLKKIKKTSILDPGDLTVEYTLIGEKGPAVVFESGLGHTLKVWENIIAECTVPARLFLYNRAGYGKSKSSNQRRDGRTIAEELHSILYKLDLYPPFILAGHSLGCAYVQIFTDMYRDETGGMLLIEPMTAEMDELCEENNIQEWEDSRLKKIIVSLFLSKTSKKELAYRDASLHQATQCDFKSNLFPVTIVTAGKAMWTKPLQQQWLRSHELLAQRIKGSRHIVAEEAGHDIQTGTPGLIAELLDKMIESLTVGSDRV